MVPAHHVGQAYVDDYIEAAGIGRQAGTVVSIIRTGAQAGCVVAERHDATDRAQDDQAAGTRCRPTR